jgi:hypothetical protein
MSPDPAGDLEKLRAIAMALPRAAEKISHGQPIFFIEKGKVFAQYWHDHHRDGASAVMVKTSGSDEQEMLIDRDPDLFYRPAYIGHSGWIAIRTDQPQSDWEHIADRVATSWRLVAPAKLVGMGLE